MKRKTSIILIGYILNIIKFQLFSINTIPVIVLGLLVVIGDRRLIEFKKWIFIILFLISCLSILLVWTIIKNIINPIKKIYKQIEKLGGNLRLNQPIAGTGKLKDCFLSLSGYLTEYSNLKDKLIENWEKYNLVVNTVREVVYQINLQGVILFLNPAWEEITGFSLHESVGRKFTNYIYLEDYQNHMEISKFTKRETDFIDFTIRLKTKNSSFRWVEVTAKRIIDRKGNPFISGRIHDITILKVLTEELREKQNQLLEMNQSLEKIIKKEVASNREKDLMLIKQSRQAAMGEMIGNIAHQWRQPLNALGLIIQNIDEAYRYNELTPDYFGSKITKINELIKYMSQTIEDFRNFFRPDKEKQQFSVKEVIDRTISFIEASFKSHDIGLVFSLKDDISIYGFPNEYAQVLINILNNAKDVVLERKVQNPRVTIELSSAGTRSIVEITDNGGGVPEEIIEKIFEPYFTTKQPSQGTGIGLYMSKTIIEKNMNGRLSVSNTTDGAKFRIEV